MERVNCTPLRMRINVQYVHLTLMLRCVEYRSMMIAVVCGLPFDDDCRLLKKNGNSFVVGESLDMVNRCWVMTLMMLVRWDVDDFRSLE